MSTTKHITLQVEGMTCNNCALGVTKRLKKLGHEEVHTDFSSGEVRFLPQKEISLDETKAAIKSIGFEVLDADDASEKSGLSLIEKKLIFSAVFTIPLFAAMFLPESWIVHNPWFQLVICLPVFGVGLWHFGKSAIGGLRSGIANMDVLILVGSTAAFGYSLAGLLMHPDNASEYLFFETTATIITLVLLGNVLEHRSVKQTTTAIRELSELQNTSAQLVQTVGGNEKLKGIKASQIKKGDLLLVNTGDRVPCDASIERGEGTFDESMLTGESVPVFRSTGDPVTGGTLVQDGSVYVRATAVGSSSTLARIISMVKQAQADQPPIQKLGDKISSIFVPTVIGISVATFLISWLVFEIEGSAALMSAIAVLVISCPCAMGLATPTAVIAGIGRGARKGILIKGGSTLEQFAKIETVVFDKTGTLTTGRFKLEQLLVAPGFDETEIKQVLFTIEQRSAHPIAKSLVRELGAEIKTGLALENIIEHKGRGLSAEFKGKKWQVGSAEWLAKGEDFDVIVCCDEQVVARLTIKDEAKNGAKELVQTLKQKGIRTVLLSGDRESKCRSLAQELGIDEVYSGESPEGKLQRIATLKEAGVTAMVGDGINDAPALAKSDLGISLGDATQVAIDSAQVVLLKSENLLRLRDAFLIGQHTYRTIKQNLFWAFSYNIVAIPIAAVGLLNPMVAALAMAFSDVIVIGNSIRLKFKKLN